MGGFVGGIFFRKPTYFKRYGRKGFFKRYLYLNKFIEKKYI